jgi:hypothetical protein
MAASTRRSNKNISSHFLIITPLILIEGNHPYPSNNNQLPAKASNTVPKTSSQPSTSSDDAKRKAAADTAASAFDFD